MFDGSLAGRNGQTAAVAVVEHGQLPILNQQRVYRGQLFEQLHVAAVGAADALVVEPPWRAVVSAVVLAASLVREREGQLGLAHAGRVGQHTFVFPPATGPPVAVCTVPCRVRARGGSRGPRPSCSV